MAVSLQKGQKVSLSKENPGLSRVVVGLGWDEAKPAKRGLFGFGARTQAIDCDASALLCVDGKIQNTKDVVFYNNLTHPSGAVKHMGDNLTGAGEGDDEQIVIDLDRVPEQYDRVVMCVTIYQARERNQQFGMIQNSFIRLVDARNIRKSAATTSARATTVQPLSYSVRCTAEMVSGSSTPWASRSRWAVSPSWSSISADPG